MREEEVGFQKRLLALMLAGGSLSQHGHAKVPKTDANGKIAPWRAVTWSGLAELLTRAPAMADMEPGKAAPPAQDRPARDDVVSLNPEKIFPVSWDQFHRDSRALAWRLNGVGPFEAIVCITRGGMVPAAIVARELGIKLIETVCVSSYTGTSQGELTVLKTVAPSIVALGGGQGVRVLLVDDLVDTGKTAKVVRDLVPRAH